MVVGKAVYEDGQGGRGWEGGLGDLSHRVQEVRADCCRGWACQPTPLQLPRSVCCSNTLASIAIYAEVFTHSTCTCLQSGARRP